MRFLSPLLLLVLLTHCSTPGAPPPPPRPAAPERAPELPYRQRGWTDREAAAFLLDRLTFGPQPGQVEAVLQRGVDTWVRDQLYPQQNRALEARMEDKYPALSMDTDDMVRRYPAPALRALYTIVRASIKGIDFSKISEDASILNEQLDLLNQDIMNVRREDRPLMEAAPELQEILDDQEYGDFMDLMYQMMAQKMERAMVSENQLEEVLADFWFNHFNVSVTRVNDTGNFTPGYERDVIRPYVLGKFGDMLAASARHPAMITYLDNSSNNPEAGAPTLIPQRSPEEQYGEYYESLKDFVDQPGLNENYARELLELHTLGVDGGYTQRDIEELARIFTGWKVPVTLHPLPGIFRVFVSAGMKGQDRSVVEKTFYFNPEWHDAGEKEFLGRRFRGGRGIEEGEEALQLLAVHPSTARFVSTKLARRFTRAEPPRALVDRMASRFTTTEGDIRAVLLEMLRSPEFWDKNLRGEKLKTPFHYIVSAVRDQGLEVRDPEHLCRWSTQLGQPLFACQPPTGYPDERAFWTTGSGILRRMDFAHQLANGQIPGVSRPQNAGDALAVELAVPKFMNY